MLKKKVQKFLRKLKIELSYDLTIHLMGIQPKGIKHFLKEIPEGSVFDNSKTVKSMKLSLMDK
jgi:hypothetical protein